MTNPGDLVVSAVVISCVHHVVVSSLFLAYGGEMSAPDTIFDQDLSDANVCAEILLPRSEIDAGVVHGEMARRIESAVDGRICGRGVAIRALFACGLSVERAIALAESDVPSEHPSICVQEESFQMLYLQMLQKRCDDAIARAWGSSSSMRSVG